MQGISSERDHTKNPESGKSNLEKLLALGDNEAGGGSCPTEALALPVLDFRGRLRKT